jgi:hypothetical protein
MSDTRRLIPGPPIAAGSLVRTPSGRTARVLAIYARSGEASVETLPERIDFKVSRLQPIPDDAAQSLGLVILTAPDTPKPIEAALLESLRADGFTVRAEDGKVIAEHPTCQLDDYRAQCIEDNNAMMLAALEASPSV